MMNDVLKEGGPLDTAGAVLFMGFLWALIIAWYFPNSRLAGWINSVFRVIGVVLWWLVKAACVIALFCVGLFLLWFKPLTFIALMVLGYFLGLLGFFDWVQWWIGAPARYKQLKVMIADMDKLGYPSLPVALAPGHLASVNRGFRSWLGNLRQTRVKYCGYVGSCVHRAGQDGQGS